MTTVTVIINDYEIDRRTVLILEDSDFERVSQNWNNEDRILIEMQENSLFEGRTRWCDILPTHWRLMITTNLSKFAVLTDDQRVDETHPAVMSLNFLVGGLIYCLQQRTESQIEMMQINRIEDGKVAFGYTACLNMAIDLPKAKTGLRIIIDNG